MNKVGCFKIQLLETEKGKFTALDGMKPVMSISFDRNFMFREPVSVVADPFLFVCQDRLFLFYEYKKMFHHATIMMISTGDLQNWTEPVEVLREPFHLSYPWVFEDDGHIFMIPESCNDCSIRLYEAVRPDLTKFHFVKQLVRQEEDASVQMSFSDSSLVKKDGCYYLYTTIMREGINQLLLYYADSLTGPYKEHPKSPICASKKYGRNAGCPMEYRGGLYRVAQDCTVHYGDNVHILKVTKLSETDYKEEVIQENILDVHIPFYQEGGHHLNTAQFRDRTVVATDAKEYHYFIGIRAVHKLRRLAEKMIR